MSLARDFIAFDDALAAQGAPPLTQWWRDGIGAWLDAYEHGHKLELWACVGRGAAKSTALYKLSLFFSLFGDFAVPVGERHYAIVLSRLKEEAGKGTQIISRWCTLLGIAHRLAGDVIELADLPRGIRVVAASVAATSGWRSYFVGRDERSKWAEGGAEQLDAEEIDTSATAMTATHPNAPTITFGSAWGAFGAFYENIVSGSDDRKIVLGPAATWTAAPHVTEEQCRRKERDERRFRREYACEFQAGALAAFDADAIDRASREEPGSLSQPVMIIDASSGGGDSFTYGLAGWINPKNPQPPFLMTKEYLGGGSWHEEVQRDEHGHPVRNPAYVETVPVLRIDPIKSFDGGYWGTVSGSQIVDTIARAARLGGASRVFGDQRESLMLSSAFAAHGLVYTPLAWTNVNKPVAVERLRSLMREGRLSLAKDAKLREELLTFEEKMTPSGQLTFAARGRRHDDRVAILITAVLADLEGGLPLSPMAPRPRRNLQNLKVI